MDSFTLNLHRIDKDVARCDRGLEYFKDQANLDTLRNIVTTYVWDHLDIGYMQVRINKHCEVLVSCSDRKLDNIMEAQRTAYKLMKLHVS